MAEEAIEKTDSSNGSENADDKGEKAGAEEVIPTVDDYRALEDKTKKLEETNKQLYARVKKSEKQEPLKKAESPTDLSEIEKRLEKKLELKAQGYNDTDIAFINANGGDVSNPYVKSALEATRKQRDAEKAADIQSTGQSDIEKKFSSDELRGKSIEELEKILPHA